MSLPRCSVRPLVLCIFTVATVTLAVQAVHMFEHSYQVAMWISGFQDKAYMSRMGMWFMDELGALLFSSLSPSRQTQMGFESLHLLGNAIFQVGIIALLYFQRSKKVLWALFVEGFHVYEHVCLTLSALYSGTAIGMSTLYGAELSPWFSVAYRVWWHFLFNLVPSFLIVWALFDAWEKATEKQRKQ